MRTSLIVLYGIRGTKALCTLYELDLADMVTLVDWNWIDSEDLDEDIKKISDPDKTLKYEIITRVDSENLIYYVYSFITYVSGLKDPIFFYDARQGSTQRAPKKITLPKGEMVTHIDVAWDRGYVSHVKPPVFLLGSASDDDPSDFRKRAGLPSSEERNEIQYHRHGAVVIHSLEHYLNMLPSALKHFENPLYKGIPTSLYITSNAHKKLNGRLP